MPRLSDELARMTEFRRRQELDVSLAQAVSGLVQAEEVAVFRPAGEAPARRWLPQARALRLRDGAVTAAGTHEAGPPCATDDALREQALAGRVVRSRSRRGALALFPLQAGHRISGVLELRTRRSLQASSLVLIHDILRVYRNVQGLLDYGERDTLTGLLNRKTFDQLFYDLSLELAAAAGATEPATATLWVGVIDVDHFKAVNDRFGHLIGDEVLLLLAGLMKHSFREDDALFRFGGEEFVVLLRAAGEGGARQAFERFRAAVAATDFPQVGTLTVSIGFAGLKPGEASTGALGRADQAVYFAKHHGRNLVHGHEALVKAGALHVVRNEGAIELF